MWSSFRVLQLDDGRYLLFLQTCKGITFIEKFDLANVYLMSDKDILCESLSTLPQYTQYFDSM